MSQKWFGNEEWFDIFHATVSWGQVYTNYITLQKSKTLLKGAICLQTACIIVAGLDEIPHWVLKQLP